MLDAWWADAGRMLDAWWAHAGCMLGACWMHGGRMLDACWAHAGCMVGACWMHPVKVQCIHFPSVRYHIEHSKKNNQITIMNVRARPYT